jgi:hypothetical protein
VLITFSAYPNPSSKYNTTLMLWRLQYATKGRNSFVKMYALDLSPNGNTVKTKYLSMLLKIQENQNKV